MKETNDTSVYFSEEEILKIFAQLSDALRLMHNHELLGKKIIHRDIKSHNVFITEDGTVKLGDFGISKILEGSKARASTVIGTPFYISPEMVKGEKYDEKTDLWSLGVLLYEMCALKYPFIGKSVEELTKAIIE